MDKLSEKPKWWRTESGVHVEVQFENAIHVDVEFDMTDEELKGLYQRLEDQRATRVQRAVRLYFGHRKTLREIAAELKISKSQVFKDLQAFKRESIIHHKQELLKNHSPMSLMVDLETQTTERMKILWEKFEHLEQFMRVVSPTLKRTHQRLSENPNRPIRKCADLSQESKECRVLIETQKNLLIQIRNETQQLLNIYSGFGLCFPVMDGAKIIRDFDSKIEEVKIFLGQLFETIRTEVPDKTLHARIFDKLADIIRTNCLVNNWGRNDDATAKEIEESVLDR